MRNLLNKIIIVLLLLASFILTACADKKEVIGIIQFGEHDSLNDCYNGIIQGLKEELGKDFDNYKVELQNSNFDPATSAAQANTFVSKNVKITVK